MIDAGDVHLADLGAETRHVVLVISNQRFHQLAERVLVCPRMEVVPEELFPWWVDTSSGVFAVDRLASIPAERLLEARGRLDVGEFGRVRRALTAIS